MELALLLLQLATSDVGELSASCGCGGMHSPFHIRLTSKQGWKCKLAVLKGGGGAFAASQVLTICRWLSPRLWVEIHTTQECG